MDDPIIQLVIFLPSSLFILLSLCVVVYLVYKCRQKKENKRKVHPKRERFEFRWPTLVRDLGTVAEIKSGFLVFSFFSLT